MKGKYSIWVGAIYWLFSFLCLQATSAEREDYRLTSSVRISVCRFQISNDLLGNDSAAADARGLLRDAVEFATENGVNSIALSDGRERDYQNAELESAIRTYIQSLGFSRMIHVVSSEDHASDLPEEVFLNVCVGASLKPGAAKMSLRLPSTVKLYMNANTYYISTKYLSDAAKVDLPLIALHTKYLGLYFMPSISEGSLKVSPCSSQIDSGCTTGIIQELPVDHGVTATSLLGVELQRISVYTRTFRTFTVQRRYGDLQKSILLTYGNRKDPLLASVCVADHPLATREWDSILSSSSANLAVECRLSFVDAGRHIAFLTYLPVERLLRLNDPAAAIKSALLTLVSTED